MSGRLESEVELLCDVWVLCRAGLKEEDVQSSIKRRSDARAAKDYASADAERAFLAEHGIMIMDGPEGTQWRPGVPALKAEQ